MKASPFVQFLRSRFSFGLAGFVLLTTMAAFGQAAADPWLILGTGEKGSINPRTTRQDLVRMCGAANVVDQDLAEDEDTVRGTVLFPDDPERQLVIWWKDPDTKTAPEVAAIMGKKSRWHTVHGITLGTSAPELERLNGRPFRFALTNDGTDMAKETISWRGGLLEKEFQGDGRIMLELEWSPAKGAKQNGPSPDFEVDSDNPAWRAQSPHITRISWIFASRTLP